MFVNPPKKMKDAIGLGCVHLMDVEERLELDDELPLVVGNLLAIELLERVDGGTGDERVQSVSLFKLAAVRGLRATHLDLDGHGRLALLADGNLLVVTFDGSTE